MKEDVWVFFRALAYYQPGNSGGVTVITTEVPHPVTLLQSRKYGCH